MKLKVMNKTRRARTAKEIDLDKAWGNEAKLIIKSVMARRSIDAANLARMISEHGRPTDTQVLRNNLNCPLFKLLRIMYPTFSCFSIFFNL